MLITQAIHTLDLFRWCLGVSRSRPRRSHTTALHRMETEDYAAALVRLGNGAPGTISATVAAWPGSPEWIMIIGARAPRGWRAAVCVSSWLDGARGGAGRCRRLRQRRQRDGFSHEPHKAVLLEFLNAIEAGSRSRVTGEEALETQRVIETILEKEGRDMQTLLPLADKLGARLKARAETISIAKSSTGGLISAALLSVAGASGVFSRRQRDLHGVCA